MRYDPEWVRIQLLSSEDHRIFDTAVKTFRRVEVVDHGPFLRDPASIAFVATEDDQLLGWAWGTRQRHAAGYSQVQLYEIEVIDTERRRGVGSCPAEASVDVRPHPYCVAAVVAQLVTYRDPWTRGFKITTTGGC